MEQAAGRDLGVFFQQWLYRGGVPKVNGSWRWDAVAKQVVVTLQQTQPGEPFVLPIDVSISVPGARTRIERAELTSRDGRFTFAADSAPTSVELDPNVRILMDARFEKR